MSDNEHGSSSSEEEHSSESRSDVRGHAQKNSNKTTTTTKTTTVALEKLKHDVVKELTEQLEARDAEVAALRRQMDHMARGLQNQLGTSWEYERGRKGSQQVAVKRTDMPRSILGVPTPLYGTSLVTTAQTTEVEKFLKTDPTLAEYEAQLEKWNVDKDGKVSVAYHPYHKGHNPTEHIPYDWVVEQVKQLTECMAKHYPDVVVEIPRLPLGHGGVQDARKLLCNEVVAVAAETGEKPLVVYQMLKAKYMGLKESRHSKSSSSSSRKASSRRTDGQEAQDDGDDLDADADPDLEVVVVEAPAAPKSKGKSKRSSSKEKGTGKTSKPRSTKKKTRTDTAGPRRAIAPFPAVLADRPAPPPLAPMPQPIMQEPATVMLSQAELDRIPIEEMVALSQRLGAQGLSGDELSAAFRKGRDELVAKYPAQSFEQMLDEDLGSNTNYQQDFDFCDEYLMEPMDSMQPVPAVLPLVTVTTTTTAEVVVESPPRAVHQVVSLDENRCALPKEGMVGDCAFRYFGARFSEAAALVPPPVPVPAAAIAAVDEAASVLAHLADPDVLSWGPKTAPAQTFKIKFKPLVKPVEEEEAQAVVIESSSSSASASASTTPSSSPEKVVQPRTYGPRATSSGSKTTTLPEPVFPTSLPPNRRPDGTIVLGAPQRLREDTDMDDLLPVKAKKHITITKAATQAKSVVIDLVAEDDGGDDNLAGYHSPPPRRKASAAATKKRAEVSVEEIDNDDGEAAAPLTPRSTSAAKKKHAGGGGGGGRRKSELEMLGAWHFDSKPEPFVYTLPSEYEGRTKPVWPGKFV